MGRKKLTGKSHSTQKKNLFRHHFFHYELYMVWPGTEPRPPQWQASKWPILSRNMTSHPCSWTFMTVKSLKNTITLSLQHYISMKDGMLWHSKMEELNGAHLLATFYLCVFTFTVRLICCSHINGTYPTYPNLTSSLSQNKGYLYRKAPTGPSVFRLIFLLQKIARSQYFETELCIVEQADCVSRRLSALASSVHYS